MKIFIARDVPESVDDENWNFILLNPEKGYEYCRLRAFYDRPELINGRWDNAREIAQIPSYMYPEIEPGQCVELENN